MQEMESANPVPPPEGPGLTMWTNLSQGPSIAAGLAGDPARAVAWASQALALRNVVARRNAVRALRAAGEPQAPLGDNDPVITALWNGVYQGRPLVMFEALEAIRVLQGYPATDFSAPYPGIQQQDGQALPEWERESALGIRWRCVTEEIGWDARKSDPRIRDAFHLPYQTRMDRGMNGYLVPERGLVQGTRGEVLDRLRSALGGAFKGRRRQALQTLWFLEDPLAADAVRPLLGDADDAVRRDALVAAGFLGDEASFPSLTMRAEGRSRDAPAAISGLAALGDIRVYEGFWREMLAGKPRASVLKAVPLLDEASDGIVDVLVENPGLAAAKATIALFYSIGTARTVELLVRAAAKMPNEQAADALLGPYAIGEPRLHEIEAVLATMRASLQPTPAGSRMTSYVLPATLPLDYSIYLGTMSRFKPNASGPGYVVPAGFVIPPGISPDTARIVIGGFGLRGPRKALDEVYLASEESITQALVNYLRGIVEDPNAAPQWRGFAWRRLLALAGPLAGAVHGATPSDRAGWR